MYCTVETKEIRAELCAWAVVSPAVAGSLLEDCPRKLSVCNFLQKFLNFANFWICALEHLQILGLEEEKGKNEFKK